MRHCRCLTYYLLVLLLWLPSCRSREEVPFSLDPVDNVEALWQIIDTKYCYVEEKGVDWNAIHDEYIAKASLLPKDDPVVLFDLCAAMLDSLHDGHVNLYSSFDRSANTAWLDTCPANFDASVLQLYLHDYRVAGGLYYTTVDDGRIGYIYYPSFSDAFTSANIYWVFRAFEKCRGLIIDVRNNGGGEMSNAYMLSAPFFTADQTIGYWSHKTGPGHHDFSPLEPLTTDISLISSRWEKPVAVLCNRRTYSAANMFVNIMRYAPNASIVGGLSGGGGGMPMSYELPCGWMVRFSSIRLFDRDKQDLENGIQPDVPVTLLSTDKDDIIEAAITLINSK